MRRGVVIKSSALTVEDPEPLGKARVNHPSRTPVHYERKQCLSAELCGRRLP